MTSNDHPYDPATLPDLLPIYYKKLFPYGLFYRWLYYGGASKTYFQNREFSFTLKDDVYVRYQSYSNQSEMEKEIQKWCPHKIDIGAVFSHKPKEHKCIKATAFQPLEKELVFDIDMTDYDDVRRCCSGAGICRLCWPLMTIAVKILDTALREDFGFEHLLWVYSGRRGIHCWVCDESARKLCPKGRSAIAEYLSVVKGGENQTKKVVLGERIHPSIARAIKIIEDHFLKYAIEGQGILGDEDAVASVLALVPDEEFRKYLKKDFADHTCKTRWDILRRRNEDILGTNEFTQSRRIVKEIMLQYCYPRLDINVSKGVNHLLKSPFCVHPKTGRVCVPMDVSDIDRFDPLQVPTISQLIDELNVKLPSSATGKKVKEYKLTSLKASTEVFQRFLKRLEASGGSHLSAQNDDSMDF